MSVRGDAWTIFARTVWCFADLTEADVAVAGQAHKAHLMCDTYGDVGVAAVLDALTARFHRARAQHLAMGRHAGAQAFEDLLRWMDLHIPAYAHAAERGVSHIPPDPP